MPLDLLFDPSPALLAMTASQSIQVAFVAFTLSGLIAVLVHRTMVKHNKDNKDSNGKPRFDSTGAWMFVAIITIPCGVVIWAILTAVATAMWSE